MFFRFMTLTALLLFVSSCGYSVGAGGVDRNSYLYPADATTQQPLDVEVSAEFGTDINEPDDWSTVFTLKKGGAGDNLCTDYNFDGSRNIAYCLHDDLEPNTSYETVVGGILAMNGAVAVWQTAE